MNQAYLRRPSQIPIPHGLWSLWDMLHDWGYQYFTIGLAISYMETSLQVHLGLSHGADAKARRANEIGPDHEAASFLLEKCREIERFLSGQDLGAIPGNITALQAKILLARRQKSPIYPSDLLTDVERIKNDFSYILHKRFFYSLAPEFNELYGQPALFGEKVAKKFRKAADDTEWAGNCLALGQPTACVLHLDRTMEIALRNLAGKLGLTPAAKDTMGKILNDMEAPINKMPDKTDREKRRKEDWSDCRINLRHVKSAWRDPTSHGKRTYDQKQARQVFDRVKEFMQQLATLL